MVDAHFNHQITIDDVDRPDGKFVKSMDFEGISRIVRQEGEIGYLQVCHLWAHQHMTLVDVARRSRSHSTWPCTDGRSIGCHLGTFTPSSMDYFDFMTSANVLI